MRTAAGFSVILWTAVVFGVGGCAGKSVTKIEDRAGLPAELSELEQKFEVKDEALEVPQKQNAAPEPGVVPVTAVRPARARKSPLPQNKKAADEAVPAVFEYPVRRPKVDPIWPLERHVFEITYFGVAAGDFTLEVLPFKTVAERKVYHVRGRAVSSKVFSMFYRLNDTIETFFDYEGFFSHRFHLVLDETKQSRDALELYDSEKRQTFYWNRWNRKEKGYTETKDFFPMEPFPQDMLSALYYLRTLPLPTGAVITFPVVSEGKSWEAVVTVMRREMLDTPLGRVSTVVLKPETKLQGVLKKQGDSFLWLTDDHRRFVVRLEAKVKIGTVIASLKDVYSGETVSGGD